MENPLRTARYLAHLADRQNELRAWVQETVGGLGACVLEIGCGHGHFLSAYASAHPDKICIGIDIISERIERAERKKNRARLKNLHFVHANADDFVATFPESMRFSEVFILFPDPWPKRRHHKNRLMQSGLLTALRAHAGEGTRLYFRTDDASYFEAASLVVASHPGWEASSDPWAFEFETVFQERATGFQSLVAKPRA